MSFIGNISIPSGSSYPVAHTLSGTCSSLTISGYIVYIDVTCSDLSTPSDGMILNVFMNWTGTSVTTFPNKITRGELTSLTSYMFYISLNGSTSTAKVVRARAEHDAWTIYKGSYQSFIYSSSNNCWYISGANNSEPVQLYYGDATGQFMIGLNPGDFSEIEIFYDGYNGGYPSSLRLKPPGADKNIALSIIEYGGQPGAMRIRMSYWSYSYKTVDNQTGYWWDKGSGNGYWLVSDSGTTYTPGDVIHIKEIVGYRPKYYTL